MSRPKAARICSQRRTSSTPRFSLRSVTTEKCVLRARNQRFSAACVFTTLVQINMAANQCLAQHMARRNSTCRMPKSFPRVSLISNIFLEVTRCKIGERNGFSK